MSKLRVAQVNAGAASAVGRGHPWIWRDAVVRPPAGAKTGDPVSVQDSSGRIIAMGLWDATSPLAIRVYAQGEKRNFDGAMLVASVARALARRDRWKDDRDTTAYRLCHGEGDRVPGVVIDRYAETAVLRLDGDAISVWTTELTDGLWPLLESLGIRSFALRAPRGAEGEDKLRPIAGAPPPDKVTVRENGIAMVVDLARGQKTGAFLDQRDNRRRVRDLSRGRRVLNLFSYAGGFSTAAALGGATHVTSVDIAQAAHATAQESMRANDIDPSAHSFVTADAFAFLESAHKKGQRWDVVISDPPSFAPNEKSRPRALTAYRKLHRACAAVLTDGGIFCASSCSSHVSAEEFATTLDDGAVGRSDLSLVEMHGAPWDHPTTPAFPEGRYLKFFVLC
ncbi:MAG: class I SAM-dependent rRNA methyltransferase [Polyangiaceae bacterium]